LRRQGRPAFRISGGIGVGHAVDAESGRVQRRQGRIKADSFEGCVRRLGEGVDPGQCLLDHPVDGIDHGIGRAHREGADGIGHTLEGVGGARGCNLEGVDDEVAHPDDAVDDPLPGPIGPGDGIVPPAPDRVEHGFADLVDVLRKDLPGGAGDIREADLRTGSLVDLVPHPGDRGRAQRHGGRHQRETPGDLQHPLAKGAGHAAQIAEEGADPAIPKAINLGNLTALLRHDHEGIHPACQRNPDVLKLEGQVRHAVAGVAGRRAHPAQRGGATLDCRDACQRRLSFPRNSRGHLLGRDCPHTVRLPDLGEGRSILPHH
jgi:hypothetical protein